MQFSSMQKNPSAPAWPSPQNPTGFSGLQSIGAILRSVLMSSVLWVLLAVALYGVYSFIVTAK